MQNNCKIQFRCIFFSSGVPKVLQSRFSLPLALVCVPSSPAKATKFKITVDTNQAPVDLISIFPGENTQTWSLQCSHLFTLKLHSKNYTNFLQKPSSCFMYASIRAQSGSLMFVLCLFVSRSPLFGVLRRDRPSYLSHHTVSLSLLAEFSAQSEDKDGNSLALQFLSGAKVTVVASKTSRESDKSAAWWKALQCMGRGFSAFTLTHPNLG